MAEKKEGIRVTFLDGSFVWIPMKDFIREENGFLFYKTRTRDGRLQESRVSLNSDNIRGVDKFLASVNDIEPPGDDDDDDDEFDK